MFVRSCWKPWDLDAAYALIEANPWALLVNNGPDGPFATNLPLLVDRTRGSHGVLNEKLTAPSFGTANPVTDFHSLV